jgi:hypothetical protein
MVKTYSEEKGLYIWHADNMHPSQKSAGKKEDPH